MTPFVDSFDDLVVVPTISLNPKKTKKKMKNSMKQDETPLAQEQPKFTTQVTSNSSSGNNTIGSGFKPPSWKEQKKNRNKQHKAEKKLAEKKLGSSSGLSWRSDLEEMSTSASEGEEQHGSSFSGFSSPASQKISKASSRGASSLEELSFSEMLRSSSARSWGGKSWFDVTEEDEDDFIVPLKDTRTFAAQRNPKVALSKTTIAPAVAALQKQEMEISQQVSVSFVGMLTTSLDASVLAQVFLNLELRHVGNLAVVCKAAKAAIWEDLPFWHALGGPVFAQEQGAVTLSLSCPRQLRNRFRVWVYGLDGDWTSSFQILAEDRHHSDVFAEASYMLAGMQQDDGEEEVQRFCDIVTEQLGCFDAGESNTKDAAFHFMETAVRQQELIGETSLVKMREALEDSLERALVLRADARLEDYDEVSLDELEAEDTAFRQKETAAEAPQPLEDNDSLSLAFLAALGNRHEGMDVQAAQEAVLTRSLGGL